MATTAAIAKRRQHFTRASGFRGQPNRSKQTDTGPLMPGQWVEPPKTKKARTLEDRIVAAINSGKGLVAATKEILEAEALSFDDQHLDALIKRLEAESMWRGQMQEALEAHYTRRHPA